MPAMYRGKEKIPGKTVIITGANTGCGKETARDMARRGAHVIMACRSVDRGNTAKEDIVATTGHRDILVKKCDLSSFASIKAFCQDINATENRIDILINNAGIGWIDYTTTEDGLEMQMGTNHFGHFLLTMLLLPKLKASAPSRIVVLASVAHKWNAKMDWDNLVYCKQNYGNFSRYNDSKLANMLFVLEMKKRLAGTGVTVYAVQPGAVDSDLARHTFMGNACCRCFCWPVRKCTTKTPEEGAQTSLYCALAPELANQSGKYYDNCREARPHERALNEDDARRLWEVSEEVTGVSDRGV